MKHLWKYLKDYKKECVLAPLFKLLEACFELFVPLVIAQIVDKGIVTRDMPYIIKMGLVLLLLAAVGLASAVTAQFFSAKAAVGFAQKAREALFAHIQSFSYSRLDEVGTSTLITRMTADINQVQSGVNMVLRLFLRSPIIVFGAMIMAFTIDVPSAMVFVVTIPLLSVVVFGVMLVTMPLYKKVQARLDAVLSVTRENLTGVRVIRAFHREKAEREDFELKNDLLVDMQVLVGKLSAITNPITYVIVNGAMIALIYMGALRVDSGILTQGEVVAMVNYMSQILVELVKLANLIVLLAKALSSAGRVGDVFALTPCKEEEMSVLALGNEVKKKQDAAYIEINHAHLTYAGSHEEALTDIHFKVQKGDTVGIIGGTGSGKSSLVNLLAGLYPISKGEVLLEGMPLASYDKAQRMERFGIVPQRAVLFAGTIKSNLLFGNEQATEEDMWQALTLAQAKEVVEGKEGMLDAIVKQGGKNFSGGQRQRLTIARALVRRPEILILDDSASALDYATEGKLREALKSLRGETTTFIVSQRASSIMHADTIVVLEDGEMAGVGTHEKLLATCEVYQEIYYSQFPKEGGKANA